MKRYQAVISGLGEHIYVPIEAENDKQAYALASYHAGRHLPKLLRQHIKVSRLAEGEQAIDDRAELKFVLPEGKMGRPSQGRTERLQFSTTPEIKQWLRSQRQQGETTSEVIHRLLMQIQQTYKS